MDDSPLTNTPIDDGESQTRTIRIVITIALLAGCCITVIAALAWFQPDPVELVGKYFPSSTATASRTPTITPTRTSTPTSTFTPTPNLTATQQVLEVTNTAMAIQATATSAASEGKVIIKDTFDSNKNNWWVKTSDDDYARIVFNIADGKYRWSATAHKGFVQWVRVSTTSMSDFYFTAEGQNVNKTTSGDYGLVFREDKDGNLYYFGINGNYFFVSLNYDGQWSELIEKTSSWTIDVDGPNRLSIVANGSHFIFLINDQYVADITDDHIQKGRNALAIELFEAGDEGVFEFDNVEVRVPKK